MAQEAHAHPDSSAEELRRAAEAVARSGRPRTVHAGGKALTIALRDHPQPASAPIRKRRRGRVFTMNDPLWSIVGIAQGTGVDDVSSNVDKYLMEAYEEEFPS